MDNERILVIDDDENIVRILTLYLRSKGYDVVSCKSGSRALSVFTDTKPDLVLLDVLMPEMDGFEVMRQIRANAQWADIPVIFLTADVSPETCEKGGALGAAGFMSKPLEAERMISGVEAVIG